MPSHKKKLSKKSKESSKVLWFVLDCAEDNSVCLVGESFVIYGEDIKAGDKVKFFMNATSKELEGIVKDFSVNYDDMKKRQVELNAEKKRLEKRESFHADEPRKAATKARDIVLKALCAKRQQVSSKGDAEADTKAINSKRKKSGKNLHSDSSEEEMLSSKKLKWNQAPSDNVGGSSKILQKKVPRAEMPHHDNIGSESSCSENPRELEHPSKGGPDPKKPSANEIYANDSSLSSSGSSGDEEDSTCSNNVFLTSNPYVNCDDAAADSSGSDLNEEELRVLQKLQLKKKLKDVSSLRDLKINSSIDQLGGFRLNKKDKSSHSSTTKELVGESKEPQKVFQFKQGALSDELEASTKVFAGTSKSSGLQNSSNVPGSSSSIKAKVKPMKQSHEKMVFNGKMYLRDETDDNVIKLRETSEVFVTKTDLDAAKDKSNSITSYARKLLKAVFTEEALLECSVGGKAATGKGKDAIQLRPSLGEDGVAAILQAAKSRAQKKKWNILPDSMIRQSLSAKLCEDRSSYRANLAWEQSQSQ